MLTNCGEKSRGFTHFFIRHKSSSSPESSAKSIDLSPQCFLRVSRLYVTDMIAAVPFHQSKWLDESNLIFKGYNGKEVLGRENIIHKNCLFFYIVIWEIGNFLNKEVC